MEAMEVDAPTEVRGGGGRQPELSAVAAAEDVPYVISSSSSSTEADEDEDEDARGQATRVPPRLPTTWAFSQRAAGSTEATNSAARGVPIRRRLR